MSNETIWIRGGDQLDFANLIGNEEIYLYGSPTTYHAADDDGAEKITDDLDFKCDIPIGQTPGYYRATQYYKMKAQT